MYESKRTLLRLADGRNLDVVVSGPPDGRVLVFHHGTPGSPTRAMTDVAHRLGLRFVTFWRPGYGQSTRKADRNVADVAADTAAVLNFVGIGRCLIAGWSGGGPHALACGARLAERVAAVAVIAGPAPYPADGLDWTAGMSEENVEGLGVSLQGEAAERPYIEAARTQILQAAPAEIVAGLGDSLPPVDQAALAGDTGEDMAGNFQEGLRLGVDGWIDDDLSGVNPWGFEVAEVAVPTTLWQGTEDRLVPVSHGEWLAQRVPGMVAHIEQGEGHVSIGTTNMDRILQELVEVAGRRM
jgi:pimeloyl-ACP methyl ester carboxylesterase